jgi:hypothetical protein
MKTLLISLLIATAGTLMGQNDWNSACLDNCGQYDDASCTNCHIEQGGHTPVIWICADCPNQGGGLEARTKKPQVPMQGTYDTVVAFVQGLSKQPSPKYLRLAAVTPQIHVSLMKRALRLKLDGPLLGSCPKAFKIGTLDKLPAEIIETNKRLALVIVR